MKKYILGIETSCDDTSISILENDKVIKCITISSEIKLKEYGGIIPEIASREHVKNIILIFKNLIQEYNIDYNKIDLIAYTSKPGMITSLHIGKIFSKTLSWFLKRNIIEIDHIEAHIFSPFINNIENIKYPFISLVASGGTTSIYKVNDSFKIEVLNSTKDDAIGEAYDKIGKYLELPYPGGPSIDRIFDENQIIYKYKLPKAYEDFSFSGIKSNIKRYIEDNIDNLNVVAIASSFQFWAITNLFEKINYYLNINNIKIITISGGVSANSYFRKKSNKYNYWYLFPDKEYSCDNAAMIALLGFIKYYK